VKAFPLRPTTAQMLRRPIHGRGGFQSLMRRVQLGLRGRQLRVAEDDFNALIRATSGPTVGGFQLRARDIVVDGVLEQLRLDGFPMREDPYALDKRGRRDAGRVLSFHGQRALPFEEGE
jgi:hypothetical protein